MSGPKLKTITYHLTVMDPDDKDRPVYSVKSATPFIRPVVGDLLPNLDGSGATLRVKSVEMTFVDMGKHVETANQVLLVYTDKIQDGSAA